MAIPPPPGPPPPPNPPSMGGLKLGSSSGGGDARNALLQSIQKGTKLKKTVTVDKSGPALSGKVCGGDASSSPTVSPKRSINNNNTSSNNNNNIGNGAPKLGGLFEGLSSMPKLKPVNGSRVGTSSPRPSNDATSVTHNRNGSPPTMRSTTTTNTSTTSNSNGPMDFNAELKKNLTLKRQKQQQQAQPPPSTTTQINATEANLKTNRGPPPQPPTAPPKNISTNISDSISERIKGGGTVRANPLTTNSNEKASSPTLSDGSGSSSSSNRIIGNSAAGSVRSKAANLNLNLGNNIVNSKNSQTISTTMKTYANNSQKTAISTTTATTTNVSKFSSTSSLSSSSSVSVKSVAPNKSTLFGGNNDNGPAPPLASNKSPTPGIKPAPNHGKPNFAPKPPGIQQFNMANGQRPAVARHHSMRSPRSPPIAPGGGPVFPTQQHFGTLRTPLQLCQSQEAINNNIRTAPNPPIGRPTVKPPPPPAPARSISNSNLNNISATPYAAVNTSLINNISSSSTTSTPATTQPPSTSSSSGSVAALRDQFRTNSISSSSTASTPPPPPPSNTMMSLTKVNSSPLGNKSGIKPIILNGGPLNVVAPPLPPHRTCPAPPPPQRQSSNSGINANTAAPPVPPQRHSSIRASAPLTPPNITTAPFAGTTLSPAAFPANHSNNANNSTAVGRLVIDLESKFGKSFHKVTEFPKPPPFLSIQKVYPSRTVKATNAPNNNIITQDNNNSITTTATSKDVAISKPPQPPSKPLQPAYIPMKKNRAPAPPQVGVAAATVNVIRQSSFLYGSSGIGAQIQQQ